MYYLMAHYSTFVKWFFGIPSLFLIGVRDYDCKPLFIERFEYAVSFVSYMDCVHYQRLYHLEKKTDIIKIDGGKTFYHYGKEL